MSAESLRAQIREVPDFPKPGILFYDITTLLNDAAGFHEAIELMTAPFEDDKVDIIVGMESRGFIFSAPMALHLGARNIAFDSDLLGKSKTTQNLQVAFGLTAFF